MNMSHVCWEENANVQRIKYERCGHAEDGGRLKDDRNGIYQCCDSNLNFSTATCSEDDCEYGTYKKSKVARQDPMSHRIIEKRRRDRMNNCLADLSRLIPTEYLKKGRGRIEKTEIIEMAIKHMKHLQTTQDRGNSLEHYRLGFQECMSEAMRFLVEVEGHFPREPELCVRLLSHLRNHCEQVTSGGGVARPSSEPPFPAQPVGAPPSPRPPPCDFTVPKTEPENSNSSDAFATRPEREPAQNGASYKYKTNIKLRFSQDTAHEVPKRGRIDDGAGAPPFDNQSSNPSPPLMVDANGRSSDTEHTTSRPPSDCASPIAEHQEPPLQQRLAGQTPVMPNPGDNYDVPIFALHTKGSYYVPLSIDYKSLAPSLQNPDQLEVPQAAVLHPVTINVNFLSNLKSSRYKYECNNNWH